MPRKRTSELVAGAFVVAGIVVLLGVVLWLGAADALKTRGQIATFYVPMSAGSVGIIQGAEVTLGDGRIGRIVEIVPDPNDDPNAARCLYHARLERKDFTIRSNARAIVVSPAVGQAKIVLLDAGDGDGPADDTHPVLLTGGLDQAMQHVSRLAENLVETSEQLRYQLNPAEAASLLAKIHGIVGKVRSAATNVVALTANIETQTKADDPNNLVGKIHRSASDINEATGHLARQTDAKARDSVMARISRAAGNVEAQTDPNTAGSLLAKVHGTMDEVHATVEDGRPKVARALTAVANAAEKIEAYAAKDVADLLATLREANTKILKISSDFAVVSEQTKEIVTTNRDNIDETLDNLTHVSVDLKSAAKEIRRNPWRLLYTPEEKELRSQNLYDAVRSFSNGAEQLDQAIGKLRLLEKVKSDDPAFQETSEKIHKHLKEVFAKFSKAEQALWKELQK